MYLVLITYCSVYTLISEFLLYFSLLYKPCAALCDWVEIRSWCWQPNFPFGEHYIVAMSAHCHKSVPLLIWPLMLPGRTNPSTISTNLASIRVFRARVTNVTWIGCWTLAAFRENLPVWIDFQKAFDQYLLTSIKLIRWRRCVDTWI